MFVNAYPGVTDVEVHAHAQYLIILRDQIGGTHLRLHAQTILSLKTTKAQSINSVTLINRIKIRLRDGTNHNSDICISVISRLEFGHTDFSVFGNRLRDRRIQSSQLIFVTDRFTKSRLHALLSRKLK